MPSLTQRFYVDRSGKYLGSWTDFEHPREVALDRASEVILVEGSPWVLKERIVMSSDLPAGAIEVAFPPADGRDVWDGEKYIPHVELPPAPDTAMLIALLVKRGVISEADIAAEINAERKSK